jgi:hypothetical protein
MKRHSTWNCNWNYKNGHFYLEKNYKNNKPCIFFQWFKTRIQPRYPNPINLYCFGLFAVKKNIILNRPLEYYKKLLSEVNHHVNPSEGHFFERSWYYIFNE